MKTAAILVALLATSVPAIAARPPTQTIILLDESGSMKKNDPRRLSLEAVRLFYELSAETDQIAVVAFGDRPRELVPLESADDASRAALRGAMRRVRFADRTTDVEAALVASLELFETLGESDARRAIVLLTDGKVDLGPRATSANDASTARIREEVAAALGQRGVRTYTIAFTRDADRALMKDVARATRGEFRYLPDARTLAGAFAQMFSAASDLENLPLRDGAFVADPSIRSTALVLSKGDPRDNNTIRSPRDELITADTTAAGVEWRSHDAYDYVTLTDPEAGPWQVRQPPDSAPPVAVVMASDVQFKAFLAPAAPRADDKIVVRAEIHRDGAIWNSYALHEGLVIEATIDTAAATNTVPLARTKDGGYVAELELAAGAVVLTVRARSAQLDREKRIAFDVLPAASPTAAEPAPSPPAVRTIVVDPGPWPWLFGGALALALVALTFGIMMRARAKRSAALPPPPPPPPPPPESKEAAEPEWKVVLLEQTDMSEVFVEGNQAALIEAIDSVREDIGALQGTQEKIQGVIDEFMGLTVAVANGLQGLGGGEELDPGVEERRDALIEKMRTVDAALGGLCDETFNLGDRIQSAQERVEVVTKEGAAAAAPPPSHNAINELILRRADAQTVEEFERLRSELLASYSEGAEVVELRSELDAKLAEVQALEGKLTDVETAKGELESNLNEVTEEYRRMFDEFQVDGSEPSHDAAEA